MPTNAQLIILHRAGIENSERLNGDEFKISIMLMMDFKK